MTVGRERRKGPYCSFGWVGMAHISTFWLLLSGGLESHARALRSLGRPDSEGDSTRPRQAGTGGASSLLEQRRRQLAEASARLLGKAAVRR